MKHLVPNNLNVKRSGLLLGFYFFCFTLVSCDEETIEIRFVNTTTLNLINQLEDGFTITSWKIPGYEFQDLNISPGYSQHFGLFDGMRYGYKNVEITISLSSGSITLQKNYLLNFKRGGVTSFALSGCGGCDVDRTE